MPLKVYINGKLYDKEEAKVSVYDHGLLYGDGVFEGIRVYKGKTFRGEQHIDRLFNSAKAIALEIPMTKQELIKAIYGTLGANNLKDGYVRVVVTRGVGKLGLDPKKCHEPQVIIITDNLALYPQDYYEKGLELITAHTVRNPHNVLSPKVKSLNYLNNILARIEAQQAGAIEAVMLNKDGFVAECTGDNIFIGAKGKLVTPPPEAGILEGITRQVVMDLAKKDGITTVEQHLTPFDLYVADECFLTGTAAEIIPAVRIDGRQIGTGRPGPITLRLHELFHEETQNNP